MKYLTANSLDMEEIIQLLVMHQLPVEDLPNPAIHFEIARMKEQMAGCIGLEIYQPHALLRSFAVHPEFQNQGIGKELLNRLFAWVKMKNITTLHLLTTTADQYFRRLGFRDAIRSEAPEAIKSSREFTSLCPSSSVYMVYEDITRYGRESKQE